MSVSRETLMSSHGWRDTLPPPSSPPLDSATAERIDTFLRLLMDWNGRINLVGHTDPSAIWVRHIEDSLQLLPLLPIGDGPMADLGSGAGFPGLILAIASRRPVHLIEADQRKAAFLTEVSARLALTHVAVHSSRIESVRLPPLDVVTARALAPLTTLLGHVARLLRADGTAIFPKGRTAEAELAAARRDWAFDAQRFASRTNPDAVILRVSNLRPRKAEP